MGKKSQRLILLSSIAIMAILALSLKNRINLCLGLEHMHSKDIIHRDLKSLNIFITKDQVAKIGDLGCAMNLNEL